ncbi:adenyl-nucleotide exchange factor sse1 [Chytridiales sp. JEL 0842]|nr:adenyl-nucleotide exchange factor sse1 [Chytridiales sp. JEL 0842]
MSVVGIDLGNLNTVVAVARNRGIDVITNETSNRATPSLVSFGEKQRYMGESAKTQEISNFKSTVSTLKRLIGRQFSDPEVHSVEAKFVNAKLVEGERGEVAAQVQYQGETRTFTITQLTAMFLSQVKDFTQKEIKIPCTDCVISVPGWFTDRQRRAMQVAAEIAGLNPLKLINDLTAAALGYGITKTDLPDTTADPNLKPRNVVFFDLGHSSYQVAVVQFVKGKLTVKSTAFDRNLGGRDFDEVLSQHYTDVFSEKYKIDIRSNPKAVHRLRQACEKVKKILSANSVTMLNVECLMDDKDVSAEVKKADYMEWTKHLTDRLVGPLEQALQASGLTKDDIDFVELCGGSTRVPTIKEFLGNYFNTSSGQSKVSTTLNLDEAVARGCALQCAIISPVFKVRDFTVQDWNGYPINLSWDAALVPPTKTGEIPDTDMEVFGLGNSIPSVKALTFARILPEDELAAHNGSVSLDIHAHYGDVSGRSLPFTPENNWIGTFTVKGIRKLNGDPNAAGDGIGKATIKLKARLDGNQIVGLESAQQIEEVLVAVEEEKKDGEKKEGEEKKEGAAAETTPASTATPMDTDEPAPVNPTQVAPGTKLKRVTRKHDLTIVAHTGGASRELVREWHASEMEMEASDRLVIDTAEKRNQLEEYVYYARDKLDMAWSDFVADADKSAFSKELNDMEDWLYGDGEEATKSVYIEKLTHLKAKGDPIAQRYTESEERPRAEKMFREYINTVLINLSSDDGRYAHIPQADLDKVKKDCEAKLNWLNDTIAAINDQPKHVNPKVTAAQIAKERENLFFSVNPVLTRPKPAPKKEEEKKEEEKKEEKKEEEKKEEDGPKVEEVPAEGEKMELD